MSFLDFCHYFSGVQICCIGDNYSYTSFKTHHEKGDKSIIGMVLEKESHVYLSVIQRDKKCFGKNDKYEYSNAGLILGKVNSDNTIEYIYGKMKLEGELWEEEELEAGEYLVYVEIDWC